MKLNWGFLKVQLGNRFGEKIKIIQIQPRFVSKLSIHLEAGDLGMICTRFLKFYFGNRFSGKKSK